MNRRQFVAQTAAIGAAAGTGMLATPAAAATAQEINAKVSSALQSLYATRPGFRSLGSRARGILVIPEIIKAGFIIGGAYGEGSLIVSGATQSYWSYGAASLGLQAGAQKTGQALFFMTDAALQQFIRNDGVEIGADLEVTAIDNGGEATLNSIEQTSPVIGVTFNRKGLLGGASFAGGKYTRIVR